jgi:DNA-binding MarR family transcriptional regulator
MNKRPASPGAAATSDGVPDTSFLETLVGYNARRAALAVIEVFLRRMAPFELRPVDFSVLSVIAHNPGVTSRQICSALEILPPNLVGMVKGLQERDLVQRRPHPSDRRAQGLHLTAAGERLHQQAEAAASALEAEATAALSPEEVRTLIGLLRKLYRSKPAPGQVKEPAQGLGDTAL